MQNVNLFIVKYWALDVCLCLKFVVLDVGYFGVFLLLLIQILKCCLS
jgi:hypothetical protein